MNAHQRRKLFRTQLKNCTKHDRDEVSRFRGMLSDICRTDMTIQQIYDKHYKQDRPNG